jgi:hypothetical protein
MQKSIESEVPIKAEKKGVKWIAYSAFNTLTEKGNYARAC